MKKIICFDIRCLQIGHENRGIGMHVRSILENLDKNQDYEYIFYAYDINDPIKKLSIGVPANYRLIQTPALKHSIERPVDFIKLLPVIFHKFDALKTVNIDVFVQFDFMLGIPRQRNIRRTAMIAYDLIPLLFKEEYIPSFTRSITTTRNPLKAVKKGLRAIYYQQRYRVHYANFSKADILISISKNTAESVSKLLGISSKKIVTIPLAPAINTDTQLKPKGATSRKYLFYIGATDSRKHVEDLIEAYDIIREQHDIDLLLVGKEFSKPKKIPNSKILKALDKSKYRSDIHTLGYVNDSEKLWLYKHASLFVFPTAYEGFGMPIVEALQSGCPVVSYENSSIPEVAGSTVRLVKTRDVSNLAKNIHLSLTDKDIGKSIKKGMIEASMYTWGRYMHQFYKTMDSITKR